MKQIVELNNITKFYGNEKALDNICIKIYKNSLIGLVGLNGSGKTTLLSTILGLITNFQGELIKENDVKISGLIDQPIFYSHLSAFENLFLISLIKDIDDKDIDYILNQVNLGTSRDKKFKAFSLGMKKRLGIAAALIGNPDIILLDEPISGLDPHGIKEIREIIYKLFLSGKTIIISSHILSEIEALCTHILFLDRGKVNYYGDKKLLINKIDNLIEIYTSDTYALSIELEKIKEINKIEVCSLSILAFFIEGVSIETATKILIKNGINTNELSMKKNTIENAIFNFK